MKEKFLSIMLVCLALFTACADGNRDKSISWEEQYNLGVRYLASGDYEEAIIAFSAVIEIDPKQELAYVGLADSYIALGNYDAANETIVSGILACGETEAFIRIQNNLTFLMSDQIGIRITEFYFDKSSYLNSQNTEFVVSVAYRCPDNEKCILMIGANTKEPNSFAMMDEDYAVSGSGGYQFTVHVKPVQWENQYFGIYVNLSEADHGETWTPFGADMLYIDSEGNVLGGYGASANTYGNEENRQKVFNEYGGEAFETKIGFQQFEQMDELWQDIIISSVEATREHDRDRLFSLLNDSASFGATEYGTYIYTVWNGNKIHLGWSHADEPGRKTSDMDIEIRPESGQGYKCSIYIARDMPTEEAWHEYYYNIDWYSANCTDWQWNGIVRGDTWNHRLWKDFDGNSAETYETSEEEGEIQNGLRVGSFTVSRHEITDWTPWDDTDVTSITTIGYNNGKEISRDGNPTTSDVIVSLDGSRMGGSIRDQWVLDRIYW